MSQVGDAFVLTPHRGVHARIPLRVVLGHACERALKAILSPSVWTGEPFRKGSYRQPTVRYRGDNDGFCRSMTPILQPQPIGRIQWY